MIKFSCVVRILLISARFTAGTVRLIEDGSRNDALPPLPDPPLTDTPQKYLGGTPPTDLLAGGGWVGIDASGNPVNLGEEVLVKQRCELFRGVLNLLNDFLINLPGCHKVLGQVIKKHLDFDGVSLKAIVNICGLDEVSEVRVSVQVLRVE